MVSWFVAGGFGMVLIALLGLGSLFVGGRALGAPTEERLRFLRAMPGLLMAIAVFSFGTGLWAVNLGISKAPNSELALLGILEAAQCLTLGGLLSAGVIALRVAAERRSLRAA